MNATRRHVIRIGAMAGKEIHHVRRDPRTLALALVAPVFLILLFGYGVSFDVDNVSLAIVDQDHTRTSRDLIRAFTASGEFHQIAQPPTVEEAVSLTVRGEALGVLVIPTNFAWHIGRHEPVDLQWLADGADVNTANQTLANADAIGRVAIGEVLHVDAGQLRAPFEVSVWSRFNPAARSALFMVPGLIAFILALVAVLLTALTIAREWEQGSMEQLFATPVSTFEIVAGKLLPYLALGMLATLLAIALGVWTFNVPIEGSLWALGLATLIFLVAMLGQGLVVSVVTRNQMVATQVALLTSLMPTLLLSGFLFPVANMPMALRIIAGALPASHFVTILRGVMLKGNGFAELWRDLLAMVGFGAVMILVATRRFRRTLDPA